MLQVPTNFDEVRKSICHLERLLTYTLLAAAPPRPFTIHQSLAARFITQPSLVTSAELLWHDTLTPGKRGPGRFRRRDCQSSMNCNQSACILACCMKGDHRSVVRMCPGDLRAQEALRWIGASRPRARALPASQPYGFVLPFGMFWSTLIDCAAHITRERGSSLPSVSALVSQCRREITGAKLLASSTS